MKRMSRDDVDLLLCKDVDGLLKLKKKNMRVYKIATGLIAFAGVFSVAMLISSAVYISNADKNLSEFKESQEYLEEVQSQEQELNASDMNDDDRQQKLENIYSDENALAILKNSNSPLRFQYQNNYDISTSCSVSWIVSLASVIPIGMAGKRYGDRCDYIDKKLKEHEKEAVASIDWKEIFDF